MDRRRPNRAPRGLDRIGTVANRTVERGVDGQGDVRKTVRLTTNPTDRNGDDGEGGESTHQGGVAFRFAGGEGRPAAGGGRERSIEDAAVVFQPGLGVVQRTAE